MNTRLLWTALALLTSLSNVFGAQDVAEKFDRIHTAIGAIFPEKNFSVWEGTEGDIDRDGVSDYAAVIVLEGNSGGREERVVVLAGTPDGKYKPLSVSGKFCEARKFYGLTIGANSLFVQVVSYADSARAESLTLQFRYNARLADFELIGDESLSEDYENDSYYRVSSNYLTKTVIHSRHAGKRDKRVNARLNDAAIARLQGFDCSGYGSAEPGIYIDESFKVHKPSRKP
jgi:hypothetical protein